MRGTLDDETRADAVIVDIVSSFEDSLCRRIIPQQTLLAAVARTLCNNAYWVK